MNEKCCTFFGHRSCPVEIKEKLYHILEDLIINQGVKVFYIGNHGAFDKMVHSTLREFCQRYPYITCVVVLAYLPSENNDEKFQSQSYSDTIYPEGIETVPKHFAIDWRNRWMIKQADYVVTYITHSWGGAAKYTKKAKRSGKKIINIIGSFVL